MRHTQSVQHHGTALVTGAGKRIGKAIAKRLALNGWSVIVHYLNSRVEAEETCHEICAASGIAIPIRADLSQYSEMTNLINVSAATLGPVTCLINNASILEFDDITCMTPDSWHNHMTLNLQAPVFLSQIMARALPDDRNGNIINIIDQCVWKQTPLFLSYALSKSALWTATRSLAQALAPGIRVNAIGPGPTLANTQQTPRTFANQQQKTLLGYGPNPEEIAHGVHFLLDAITMTGQMLALDGGQHLTWQTPDIMQELIERETQQSCIDTNDKL